MLSDRPRRQSRNGPCALGQSVRRESSRERVLEARDEHDGAVWDDGYRWGVLMSEHEFETEGLVRGCGIWRYEITMILCFCVPT